MSALRVGRLAVLLTACSALLSAQSPIEVRGKDNCCPLTFTAKISWRPNGNGFPSIFDINASITNNSDKEVLLLIWKVRPKLASTPEISADDPTGDTFTQVDEGYFGMPALAANATQTWQEQLHSAAKPSSNDAEPSLIAAAEISFAQFSDGTYCGDPRAASGVLAERRETLSEIQRLSKVYVEEGAESFASELMKPSELPLIRGFQRMYVPNSSSTLDAVHSKLERMLEEAKKHEAQAPAGLLDPVNQASVAR
jgi:hypothetical protein